MDLIREGLLHAQSNCTFNAKQAHFGGVVAVSGDGEPRVECAIQMLPADGALSDLKCCYAAVQRLIILLPLEEVRI